MTRKSIIQLLALALLATTALCTPTIARAEEDEIAKQEAVAEADTTTKSEQWAASIKERYKLTDEQIKKMQDAGLKGPQMSITAGLAEKSGKPIDDIMKMRLEQKMGWGKIAKELGVHPGEIGKSVSSLHHEVKDKNKEAKADAKAEAKEERKEARKAEKAERKKEREEKKQERKEQRSERKEERKEKSGKG